MTTVFQYQHLKKKKKKKKKRNLTNAFGTFVFALGWYFSNLPTIIFTHLAAVLYQPLIETEIGTSDIIVGSNGDNLHEMSKSIS